MLSNAIAEQLFYSVHEPSGDLIAATPTAAEAVRILFYHQQRGAYIAKGRAAVYTRQRADADDEADALRIILGQRRRRSWL